MRLADNSQRSSSVTISKNVTETGLKSNPKLEFEPLEPEVAGHVEMIWHY